MKYIKSVLTWTCAAFTAIIIAITASANFITALKSIPFRFTNILAILAFSFAAALVSLVFHVERLGVFARIVIHYAALTVLLFLSVVVFGDFAGESASRSSAVFLLFLLYTFLYAATAVVVCAVLRRTKKTKKNEEKEPEEYVSQF